jgi:hypothetical protein
MKECQPHNKGLTIIKVRKGILEVVKMEGGNMEEGKVRDKVKDNPMVVPGTREDRDTRVEDGINYSIIGKIISRFIAGFFLYILS